jgi:hypothetical protein
MRKIIFILSFCVIAPFWGFSQYYWDYGARLGMANSLTDIGGLQKTAQPWILDMKLQETRWNLGGYLRYKIRDPFSIEADLDWIRLQGADSLSTNPGRRGRNLNFRNDIVDLTVKGIWQFYQNPDLGNTYRYQNAFASYLCLGVSVFLNHPQGYGDPPGGHGEGWYNLRPLKTEAESSPYHLIQPGVPVGAGFFFTFSKTYRVGFELQWTETFTDYMDDISGKYPTAAQYATMSPEAQYFSNRATVASAGDVGLGNYGAGPQGNGEKRGDPTNHDSYLTATFTVGYVIRGRSSFYRSHYGGLFSRGKYTIRRRRAKF